MKIIDTHIHVWDFEKAIYSWLEGDTSILNRTYSIDELENERQKTNVEYGVLVQAANNYEDTDWMLEVAEKTEWIKGVVGWVPLTNPKECRKVLEVKYLQNPYFKGVRHLIHDEKDAQWLLQENVIESLKILQESNLSFDVVGVLSQHIETALEVAHKVPGLKMVFDHLNKPPIREQLKFGRWGTLMEETAKYPNFHMKISGLGTISGKPHSWGSDQILDYINFSLHKFGVDRCFVGGDWPVSLLAGTYAYTWQQYEDSLKRILNAEELEKVFFSNANQFYNLNIEL